MVAGIGHSAAQHPPPCSAGAFMPTLLPFLQVPRRIATPVSVQQAAVSVQQAAVSLQPAGPLRHGGNAGARAVRELHNDVSTKIRFLPVCGLCL